MSFWANEEIRRLETLNRDIKVLNIKEKIIELSIRGNILHNLTAFVGVAESSNEPENQSVDPIETYSITNSLIDLHDSTRFYVADDEQVSVKI